MVTPINAQWATCQVKEWDRANFPALYRCADDVSKHAQRTYLLVVLANLILLLIGAAAGVIEISPGGEFAARLLSATMFFAGIGVSLLLAYHRWDRKWFSGRAIAESVKSLAWKYSTGADPFPLALPERDALTRLTDQFAELVREHKDLAADLATPDSLQDQVTRWMTGLRTAVAQVRRDVYLSQRVYEQQAWYAQGANQNLRQQRGWYIAFVFAQVAACGAMLYEALHPNTRLQIGGLLAASAAAILAWTQVKRFQELAQAYGLTAQELSMVGSRGPYVGTDEELARFVADAETAISREHTAWVARRETA